MDAANNNNNNNNNNDVYADGSLTKAEHSVRALQRK